MVAELARWAHQRGAAVEGELGHLPNFTGTAVDTSGSHLTEPDEAGEFVRATGVDCLAVSVGNVHLLEGREAALQLDRLSAVGQAAGVPLVLHGGTGLPADALPAVIAGGVAKINVGTGLKRAFLDAMREALALRRQPSRPARVAQARGRRGRRQGQDVRRSQAPDAPVRIRRPSRGLGGVCNLQ